MSATLYLSAAPSRIAVLIHSIYQDGDDVLKACEPPRRNHIWCHNGTVNLTVKNIPEEVGRQLKQGAFANGRSLNAEVVQVLSAAATEIERRRRMSASRKELERFVAKLPRMSSSARLIQEDRERR
jgi:plasmid stability protein